VTASASASVSVSASASVSVESTVPLVVAPSLTLLGVAGAAVCIDDVCEIRAD
jgi:hypothetical protein